MSQPCRNRNSPETEGEQGAVVAYPRGHREAERRPGWAGTSASAEQAQGVPQPRTPAPGDTAAEKAALDPTVRLPGEQLGSWRTLCFEL